MACAGRPGSEGLRRDDPLNRESAVAADAEAAVRDPAPRRPRGPIALRRRTEAEPRRPSFGRSEWALRVLPPHPQNGRRAGRRDPRVGEPTAGERPVSQVPRGRPRSRVVVQHRRPRTHSTHGRPSIAGAHPLSACGGHVTRPNGITDLTFASYPHKGLTQIESLAKSPRQLGDPPSNPR